MAKITYIEFNGTERIVDVPTGWSVMEGAVRNGVKGIEAECGGCCACATCHVYVEPAWRDRLPAPEMMENDMLECVAAERLENSRLACQLKVADALDGLVVRLPKTQI